jgi:hypothetical protein
MSWSSRAMHVGYKRLELFKKFFKRMSTFCSYFCGIIDFMDKSSRIHFQQTCFEEQWTLWRKVPTALAIEPL